MNRILEVAERLVRSRRLTLEEYKELVEGYDPEIAEYLKNEAIKKRKEIYGDKVFVRGLIEISNICKNNCLYCGIRGENENCQRYQLNHEEIMMCCVKAYDSGFRTFVLQGGENGYYDDDRLCYLISDIKNNCSDCAVTLSLGERSSLSYLKLFNAGADRYLLRHEAAEVELYEKLHPENMSYENRMECLKELKKVGYQAGCGFMVGAPYQTAEHIARDLKFIEEFKPEMCGIGPFIPHKDTIFANEKAGSADLTCYLLSIIRLIHPNILLPATTALGTVEKDGWERGVLSGANVIMLNLTPEFVRGKYDIYDNKCSIGTDNPERLQELQEKMKNIGYELDMGKGDYNKRWWPILNEESRERLKQTLFRE